MNRKTLALSAAIGLLVPVLAGCGGSDGGSGGEAIVVGTTDQYIATKEAVAPLDPAAAYDTGSWNVLRQTIQTLMHVPRGGGKPVPDAASKCAFTDRANESYRCTLREGLKFAGGDPITADDVKYSMERVLKINDPGGVAGLLTNIDTMESDGAREIIFHLKTPDATFPYKLSTPPAGIVSKKDYPPTKLRAGFDVSGSGPYNFAADVKGDTVTKATFTKNPDYRGDLNIQNDKVELRPFTDADDMGKALDAGDIDVMTRAMTPGQVQSMVEKPKDGIQLTEMPGLEIRYLVFDTDAPTVKEKAVRQAMAYTIDRGDLITKVYGAMAEPLYSLIPSSIATHTNSFFNKYGDRNLPKAADLLESAGIETPVKLSLDYTTDHYGEATKQEFENLRDQLNSSKLFDVSIKGTEWKTFRPNQIKGDYSVYGMGWFPDFPDPDSYTAPFLDKDNFLNMPYNNATLRGELIPQSRREADRSAATKTFSRIQDIVADDVPVLPLWQGKQYVASRDDIAGVEWAVNSSAELLLWELRRGPGA
ncbi:putative lipoprotein oligopeptide binding protein [Streptomyces sp. L-9-10]|uniref:ABC transporter substrate-binding protein n=1 Tax=Streptomyces sp. L-9-10 TaxID=1478131 RepID=UPI00101C30C4|nr:ABC transporter substrate-binding protein [Streptomyces sp. L-9-10]RYJ20723.1 putative lipoprotein oligopeptide binding protein [Streptomyces sp. L-9-10]